MKVNSKTKIIFLIVIMALGYTVLPTIFIRAVADKEINFANETIALLKSRDLQSIEAMWSTRFPIVDKVAFESRMNILASLFSAQEIEKSIPKGYKSHSSSVGKKAVLNQRLFFQNGDVYDYQVSFDKSDHELKLIGLSIQKNFSTFPSLF